jgi:hypothetical protein
MGVITMRDDPQARDYRSVEQVHKDIVFIDTPVKTNARICNMRKHRLVSPPVRGDCARVCPIGQGEKRFPSRLQAIVQAHSSS